jgi:hypothetical protein
MHCLGGTNCIVADGLAFASVWTKAGFITSHLCDVQESSPFHFCGFLGMFPRFYWKSDTLLKFVVEGVALHCDYRRVYFTAAFLEGAVCV